MRNQGEVVLGPIGVDAGLNDCDVYLGSHPELFWRRLVYFLLLQDVGTVQLLSELLVYLPVHDLLLP